MLIFPKARLTFLSMPKTGTTAIEAALSRYSTLIFSGNPYKHLVFADYNRLVVPLLASDPDFDAGSQETVCIIREPIEYLKSWYRYLSRPELENSNRSTAGISFGDYIEAVLSNDPPEFAHVRRPSAFVYDGADRVTTILRYGDPNIGNFFSQRLGVYVTIPKRNVSPQREVTPLPAELETRLRKAWADEFSLYEQIPLLDVPFWPRPPRVAQWKKRARKIYRALVED